VLVILKSDKKDGKRWEELIVVYFRRLLLVCVIVIAVIFPDLPKRLHLNLVFDAIRLNFVLVRFFFEKS